MADFVRRQTDLGEAKLEADEALNHVYDEIGIAPQVQARLSAAGFRTLDDLREKWKELQEGTIQGVKRGPQANLSHFASWYKHFEETKGIQPNVTKDFSDEVYWEFVDSSACKRIKDHLVGLEKSEEAGGKVLYSLYLDGVVESAHLAKPERRATFLSYVTEQVEKSMGHNLKDACQTFNVNVPEVVNITFQKLLPTLDTSTDGPFVIAGKTQSGKSAFKAVVIMVCDLLRMPTVLITKDVSESKDLHRKLVKYLAGSEADGVVFSPYSTTSNEADMTVAFIENKGTLVIPDTFGKINLAARVIGRCEKACSANKKSFGFVLLVDECDAMYRTVDRSQKMEMALQKLQNFKPVLQLFVSATPVPILLLYKEEYGKELSMFSLETSHDYVGVHQMKCLVDESGSPVHLDPLSSGKGIEATEPPKNSASKYEALFDDDTQCSFDSNRDANSLIPHTDGKVMGLYEHALSAAENSAKGVLLLDCTDSRVYAEGNVFQKAARVQDYYKQQGKDVFVIVHVGKGVFYRPPGQKDGKHCSKGRTVSETIASVDTKHGLDMPTFVFGYSKMKRCISYRSSVRVPTHIVVFMGQGHSVENLVQAVGRATFTGMDLLKRNGHDSVTFLMENRDFTVVKKHVSYVQEIQRRLDRGESLDEAMRGEQEKLPDDTNYIRHTSRKTGQRAKKYDIGKHHHRDSFEDPSGGQESDLITKEKYWEKEIPQKVLFILSDLEDAPNSSFATEDIRDAYNDVFDDSQPITKTLTGKCLRELRKDGLVRHAHTGKHCEDHWILNLPAQFLCDNFLNFEFVNSTRYKWRDRKRQKTSIG